MRNVSRNKDSNGLIRSILTAEICISGMIEKRRKNNINSRILKNCERSKSGVGVNKIWL